MPTFDQVLHVRLGSLREAVTDWGQTYDKLAKLQEKAENGLRHKADKANWAGENAGVTRPFVKKTAKEFGDAAKVADSIRNILRDALAEFQAAKDALEKLVEQAPGKGIRIDANGVVGYLIHPDRRSKDYDGPKPEQSDFDAMRSAIKAAIERANDADDVASRAMRTVVGADENNFSGTEYTSLQAASKAQDAEDAKWAADIVKKGDDATPKEIDRLNRYFTDNKGDPHFAERFALEVGAKGTLEYWADLGDFSDGSRLGIDNPDKLKELQKNYSLTLAAATHATSPEMEAWKSDMIKAGDDPIRARGSSPYGFQIMSNLMRVGDYDDKFLRSYGNALVATEQKITHGNAGAADRAWFSPQANHLNWMGGDQGRDPVIGFMEALGRNPGASTAFFNSDIDLTPDNTTDDKKLNAFDYFTKDRNWPEELTDKGDMSREPGFNALGHALESATTGRAHDAGPGRQDARTTETAQVMQKVVEYYGGDPKRMHEQPGMEDSLARMGTAYIDELNRALETEYDTTMTENADSPFGYNGPDGTSRFGDRFDTELLWSRSEAVAFMGIVAQTEVGHAQLSMAQSVYTASVLDVVGPRPGSVDLRNDLLLTDAKTALRIGAEAHGILDESRMAQIDATYAKESEDHKKAVGKTTEWVKFGVGVVVTGGVAAMTGGAGGALIPLAAETAGGAVVTMLGMEAADIAEKYEKDEQAKKEADTQKESALQAGRQFAVQPGVAYAMAPGWTRAESNYLREELVADIMNGRMHGRGNSLPDPYQKQ
ncbi:hypothetical protein [Streptomyces sp. NPDC047928]|uniref:hypothetical protein n=1 Tax=unclassified Streptomyces TaxID=2593676 RepID=UPI0037249F44